MVVCGQIEKIYPMKLGDYSTGLRHPTALEALRTPNFDQVSCGEQPHDDFERHQVQRNPSSTKIHTYCMREELNSNTSTVVFIIYHPPFRWYVTPSKIISFGILYSTVVTGGGRG